MAAAAGPLRQGYKASIAHTLTDARVKALDEAFASERHENIFSLIHNLIVPLINILVFLVHWRLASRASQSAG